MLTFDWDQNKNKTNKKKHGVSFEESRSVFYDENARMMFDPDHSESEERFILLGLSEYFRILVICYCYRHGDSIIRIISARKAIRKEIKLYEDYLL